MLAQETCRFSAATFLGRLLQAQVISSFALFSCRLPAAETAGRVHTATGTPSLRAI